LTLRIAIDITRLVDRFIQRRLPTGVDRVSLAYVSHYAHNARALVRWHGFSFVLSESASRKLFGRLLNEQHRFDSGYYYEIIMGVISGWRHRDIHNYILLNTGHTGLESKAYPAMLQRLGVKPIFFVHDLIPITHPEFCRAGEAQKHKIRINNMLDCAVGIIANSSATYKDLRNYCKTRTSILPKTISAPLAPAKLNAEVQPRPIDKPFFIMLGTIEPRKNHLLMLQVWRRLVEHLGSESPQLILVGRRGWESEQVFNILDRSTLLRPFVTELNDCTDLELAAYFQHAQALLFPSWVEGFGMPLVEALSVGLPVLASNLPVFHEVAGDVPDYIEPHDGAGWFNAITDYLSETTERRSAQLMRMRDFNATGWSEHFAAVDSLLSEIDSCDDVSK
jgi:glycosyltransferase involved in cell wall biosynthesis